jgi:hypothetical protein
MAQCEIETLVALLRKAGGEAVPLKQAADNGTTAREQFGQVARFSHVAGTKCEEGPAQGAFDDVGRQCFWRSGPHFPKDRSADHRKSE